MPRLFWALLAAGRGGYRYLRSALRHVTGLVSRLTQAPGSGGRGRPGPDTDMEAGMVSRPVSDGRVHTHGGGADLLGHMVAWLVSVAYPKFHAGIALLTTFISVSPDSGTRKAAKAETELVNGIRADPYSPGSIRSIREDGMAAAPEMAPPVPMETAPETETELSALGAGGGPVPGSGVLVDGRALTAGPGSGLSSTVRGVDAAESALNAHMMTWVFPVWVDKDTLYIRQVYETQWDGDTLILR